MQLMSAALAQTPSTPCQELAAHLSSLACWGAVFSRIGHAGAVRPNQHFKVLADIFGIISTRLLPSLGLRRDALAPCGDATGSRRC